MVSKIILETPPTGKVNLNWGQQDSTFKLVEVETPQLADGEVLVKPLLLSNDPTQRTWIAATKNAPRGYMPPVEKGHDVRSLALAEVLDSKSPDWTKGDVAVGLLSWSEQTVITADKLTTKVDKSLPYEYYLSVLGLTGLTAYFGLKKVGQLKEGQTVLISAASGATGSMAVQIAKHLFKASKVIGIAGSEEKCEWVKSLGADHCANYREPDYLQKLHEYIGEDYVDVYFDNVGGEILDFALAHVKRHGRVIACGAISGYNDWEKAAVRSWGEIIMNRLTIQGFIAFDYLSEYPAAIAEISAGLKSGVITPGEGIHIEDLTKESTPLKKVPEVWHRLFTDEKPKGKLLTKIA